MNELLTSKSYSIYDISQEVFSCKVYPGDPSPQKRELLRISDGDICNLSSFSMCSHNGTHVDAPFHFYENGKTIDEIELERVIGFCYVIEHHGIVTASDAINFIKKARQEDERSSQRILIKGKAEVSLEAAQIFATEQILLLGNESQTVGPENAPKEVHLTLLGADVVLLEGIRLEHVPEGSYFLYAAPINLGGADGAPCRAILIKYWCGGRKDENH